MILIKRKGKEKITAASARRQLRDERKSMGNKRKSRLINKFFLVIMAASLLQVIRIYGQSIQHKAQQDNLKEMVTEKEAKYPASNSSASSNETGISVSEDQGIRDTGSDREQTEDKPAVLQKYAELYEENKDLAGWLSIEGTKIDHPVMQCEDDEYYLHHDFQRQKSRYGCLYVRKQADLDAGTNFIIYGHNMKDGSMFGDLDLYLDENFYKEHPSISFDTLHEERTYEILAVFRSQVYDAEDDVFKYYQFYEADTQQEFNDFYTNIKELSLYDTGLEAKFGDTFLTLSTCAYHVDNGRFVVVAKRVTDD